MTLLRRTIRASWPMRVFFTEDVFAADNPVLAEALADTAPRQAMVVLDDALAQALPGLERQIGGFFSAHAGRLRLVRPPLFVPGGEAAKNSVTLVTDLLGQFHRHHLDRHAHVIVAGGGALLDVAGFAAATAHRGLRLVRLPTTTLSQANSGVGLKNGLNAFGQKNFIGTFAPPFAVINDFKFLASLTPEEKRDGYVEAVKVACLRDAKFFARIEQDAARLAAFEPAAMKRLIRRCAGLHLDQIARGGDPFEKGSARPLDFGHWAAHKLEQLTHFQDISHGRAVAIGIALDVVYSGVAGLLDENSVGRILELLRRLGFRLFAGKLLDSDDAGRLLLLDGIEEFREHLGGGLSITLLQAIGQSVQAHEMDPAKVIAALHELRQRAG